MAHQSGVDVFGNSASKVDHPFPFQQSHIHTTMILTFESLLPVNLSSGVAASDAAEIMRLQQRASILVAENIQPQCR
jgi:hypothetical protein